MIIADGKLTILGAGGISHTITEQGAILNIPNFTCQNLSVSGLLSATSMTVASGLTVYNECRLNSASIASATITEASISSASITAANITTATITNASITGQATVKGTLTVTESMNVETEATPSFSQASCTDFTADTVTAEELSVTNRVQATTAAISTLIGGNASSVAQVPNVSITIDGHTAGGLGLSLRNKTRYGLLVTFITSVDYDDYATAFTNRQHIDGTGDRYYWLVGAGNDFHIDNYKYRGTDIHPNFVWVGYFIDEGGESAPLGYKKYTWSDLTVWGSITDTITVTTNPGVILYNGINADINGLRSDYVFIVANNKSNVKAALSVWLPNNYGAASPCMTEYGYGMVWYAESKFNYLISSTSTSWTLDDPLYGIYLKTV